MDNLISLVNKIQRACTALGDHGEASALPTLWDSLPAIAVVGGQVFKRQIQFSLLYFSASNAFYSEFVFTFCVSFRALESLQCLKVLLARISYLVDRVIMPKQITFSN